MFISEVILQLSNKLVELGDVCVEISTVPLESCKEFVVESCYTDECISKKNFVSLTKIQ